MNAKEARETLDHFTGGKMPCDLDYPVDRAAWEAAGYLAALEGEEVWALVTVLKSVDACNCVYLGGHHERLCKQEPIDEALAAFNKTVKP